MSLKECVVSYRFRGFGDKKVAVVAFLKISTPNVVRRAVIPPKGHFTIKIRDVRCRHSDLSVERVKTFPGRPRFVKRCFVSFKTEHVFIVGSFRLVHSPIAVFSFSRRE